LDIRLQTIRPVFSTISPIGKAPKLTEGRHTENTKGQRTNHSSYCRACLSLLRPGKASVPLLVHCKHRSGNGKARSSGVALSDRSQRTRMMRAAPRTCITGPLTCEPQSVRRSRARASQAAAYLLMSVTASCLVNRDIGRWRTFGLSAVARPAALSQPSWGNVEACARALCGSDCGLEPHPASGA
jgi:hypothetical protein